MNIFFKISGLVVVCLLCALNNKAAAQSQIKTEMPVPEVTAAEASLSFWDMPHLKEAYISTQPTKRKDGTVVAQLSINQKHKTRLVQLVKEMGQAKHGDYDSLLISHKNALVFESYFKKGRINLPHGQASAVKAYTSLILGRAIQLGHISMTDLDKPLVSFLKDLDSTKHVSGTEKITLHKALTMHGGLGINSEQWQQVEKDSNRLKGQGLVQTLLEHSAPITTESQIYKYGNFNPMLVMTVIDAVVPGTAEDFIKTEVLDKMGITDYQWKTHVSGLPEAGWRMKMTSRDMLKWGKLVLNKGRWNGEQFISAEYLVKATSGLVKPTEEWIPESYRYGYFWYHTSMMIDNQSYAATLAWGGGGQRVIVIEQLDLVIVITGHHSEDKIMTQILESVVPAFVPDNLVVDNQYFGLKPPGTSPEALSLDIFSQKGWELGGIHADDMEEFYLASTLDMPLRPLVISFKKENRVWKKYEFYATAGDVLYSKNKYIERTESGWSQMKSLGAQFEDIAIMRLSGSANGMVVFDEATRDGSGIIRYSRLMNGKRETPKAFGKEINTGQWTAHPFIAPDESYIIWDSEREGGYGSSDLYISFRQKDGSWGAAINMGDEINTEAEDGGGYVTPDGKYFSYCPRCNPPFNRMWMDAEIIERLRLKQ